MRARKRHAVLETPSACDITPLPQRRALQRKAAAATTAPITASPSLDGKSLRVLRDDIALHISTARSSMSQACRVVSAATVCYAVSNLSLDPLFRRATAASTDPVLSTLLAALEVYRVESQSSRDCCNFVRPGRA